MQTDRSARVLDADKSLRDAAFAWLEDFAFRVLWRLAGRDDKLRRVVSIDAGKRSIGAHKPMDVLSVSGLLGELVPAIRVLGRPRTLQAGSKTLPDVSRVRQNADAEIEQRIARHAIEAAGKTLAKLG
jgi:hypothetical protein